LGDDPHVVNVRVLPLTVVLLLVGASACEGSERDAIRIGVLADCEGLGASFYDTTLAGAELPLLRRGGSLAGGEPRDGVEGVSIDGHPVELVLGCAGDAVGSVVETRRLVELEGVDVLMGPNTLPYTLAMAEYARRHPQTAFLMETMEHTTGSHLGRNVFRFTADSVQTAAGLGGYAFNELGWRSAGIVATPDLWEWGQQAGFAAEFCSLGGSILDRYWLDVPAEDVPEKVASFPLGGHDGFLVAADVSGAAKFLRRYAKRHPRLAETFVSAAYGSAPVLLDPTIVETLGDRLLGVVTASFVPLDDSREEWNAYVHEFDTEFPELAEIAASAYHLYDIDYYNSVEAVMQALESVDGDLSDGAERFLSALSAVRLEAPNGPIELDDRRQAILPIYLSRVEKDRQGNLFLRTFRTIDEVDRTYGGSLRMDGPIDRTQPPCRKGIPPPWASAG
jgi:branched-chain amino acid transport system substrate-binding protein